MALETLEFKFPHERPKAPVAEEKVEFELEGTPEVVVEPSPAEKDDIDLEIIDDTPESDRGRSPAEPPSEVTDAELENYSEKVRKRIQHFSRGYHDERRAKEAALREREEAVRAAQALKAETDKLRADLSKGQETMLAQAKRAAEVELAQLKVTYKEAYEEGDPDKITDVHQKLTSATMKLERLANFKPPALQSPKSEVQIPQPAQTPAPDYKAESWKQANEWFGADEEMTAFALGLHNKLVREGLDPQSDSYYARINARMREVFPASFAGAKDTEKPARAKPSSIVAPATRSTAPKKIVLTQSQVSIAKRLGVPLEEYAKQVAYEMRKSNV